MHAPNDVEVSSSEVHGSVSVKFARKQIWRLKNTGGVVTTPPSVVRWLISFTESNQTNKFIFSWEFPFFYKESAKKRVWLKSVPFVLCFFFTKSNFFVSLDLDSLKLAVGLCPLSTKHRTSLHRPTLGMPPSFIFQSNRTSRAGDGCWVDVGKKLHSHRSTDATFEVDRLIDWMFRHVNIQFTPLRSRLYSNTMEAETLIDPSAVCCPTTSTGLWCSPAR